MKIGLQTWGSHGDIRPFIALAEGLQSAGHEVTLLITCVDSAIYESVISASGVKIRVIASPVNDAATAEQIGMAALKIRNPLAQMKMLLDSCFLPSEEAMFAAAMELAAESDLLIGHYFMYPLQVAAEHAGKPYASVLLSYAAVPSAYSHPLGVPFGQRFLWWLSKWALHKTASPYPDRLRARLGMAPTKDFVTEVWLSSWLTLVAVSPQICERQPDWASSLQVCGFLDMPNMQLEGRLTEEVEAFLAAGEAPVYMTFGSWTPREVGNQSLNLRLFTDAAKLSGRRAIIQTHDAAACGFHSGDQILYVAASPHHLIFPRCAAVVHHGGAGTTQSTTLAGKPSVVVAHISEQEHWGKELQRLGIAGKITKRSTVTPKQLAARIQALRPEMQARATAIARAMAQENGVTTAVRIISERMK
jgi:UDP:flavonoid glycosyltransferase YjiC (YdhE family)